MHALIIEPEVLISLMLQEELRDLGFTSFDTASTQGRAIKAAQRHRPNLITSGLRLVRGNGVDAVKVICADQPIPTVFVVSDTAEVQPLVGGAPIVVKPVSKTLLHRAVRKAMEAADRPFPLSSTQEGSPPLQA